MNSLNALLKFEFQYIFAGNICTTVSGVSRIWPFCRVSQVRLFCHQTFGGLSHALLDFGFYCARARGMRAEHIFPTQESCRPNCDHCRVLRSSILQTALFLTLV